MKLLLLGTAFISIFLLDGCSNIPINKYSTVDHNLAKSSLEPDEHSLLLQGTMKGSDISEIEVSVIPGRTHSYMMDPDQFRIYYLSFNLEPIAHIRTWDPRSRFVYENENIYKTRIPKIEVNIPIKPQKTPKENANIHERYEVRASTKIQLPIPWLKNVAWLVLSDSNNNVYKRISLVKPLLNYCVAHNELRQCREWLTTNSAELANVILK